MALPIALAAIGLFAAGVIAGIADVVSVAIRREEKNLGLTSEATDAVARAGRWVNGVYVRAQRGAGVDRAGRRRRRLQQHPRPGVALALQLPSPRRPCTCPAGRDSDAQ